MTRAVRDAVERSAALARYPVFPYPVRCTPCGGPVVRAATTNATAECVGCGGSARVTR